MARAPSIALIAAAAPLCVPSAAAIAPGRSGLSVSNARLSARGRYSETTSFSDELEPGIPTVGGLRAAGTIEFSVPVRRGRFGAGGDFRRPFTYPDGTEVVEDYSWSLRGRFGRDGAAGSFRLRGVVRRRRGGEKMGSCDTGPNRWRASR